MFATFKMALPDMNETIWKQYYEKGLAVYNTHKQKIKESLDKYLSVDGELKASEIKKIGFHPLKQMCFYPIHIKTKRMLLHSQDY